MGCLKLRPLCSVHVYVSFMPFKLKYMVLYGVLNLAVVNSVDMSPMQYYLSDQWKYQLGQQKNPYCRVNYIMHILVYVIF